MLIDWGLLLLGGLLLYLGAEWLVRGAAGLALALRIRPLIIGLTVVAYGTSAPEMTVAVASALRGSGDILLGNSIGSNIANLGLILGMTALISPPTVQRGLVWRELPIMLGCAAILPLLLLDGRIGRVEGGLMAAASVLYTLWMMRTPPADATAMTAEVARDAEVAGAPPGGRAARMVAIGIVGLGLLVVGGRLFVDGAVGLARAAGISERVVGLTVVAVGTSLPELATSLVAALRGHSDIAVGNVIGSNIFNVLIVLALGALIHPIDGSLRAMALDLGTLAVMTTAAAVMLRTARRITRIEGALLVLSYVAFLIALLVAR